MGNKKNNKRKTIPMENRRLLLHKKTSPRTRH